MSKWGSVVTNVKYRIDVHTSDKLFAGTDNDVLINIMGTYAEVTRE